VVVAKSDMVTKILAVLDVSGDIAHFFLTAIWTNEIGAIVKSDAGLAIGFMAETPEN